MGKNFKLEKGIGGFKGETKQTKILFSFILIFFFSNL